MNKVKRIKSEKMRINKIFKNIPEDARKTVDGLIDRLAYMRVTLEDLEQDLLANGCVSLFTQSPDLEPYERERPAARIYLNMVSRYTATVKQLVDLLPAQKNDGQKDELMEFLKRRDRHVMTP